MATKVPAFSFSGESSSELKNGYWYIFLKSSGTLVMNYAKTSVDVFLCGGGGGGGSNVNSEYGGAGGGGGYLTTKYAQAIAAGQHDITIGAGGAESAYGAGGNTGGTTSAFGFSAAGGQGGQTSYSAGSIGGAGTGAGGNGYHKDKTSVTVGSDGKQAFGEGDIYYGAGGGGAYAKSSRKAIAGGKTGGGNGGYPPTAGQANTGSGGGGAEGTAYEDTISYCGAAGGSGIVILRGTEDDFTPVFFNGTKISEIDFNGESVSGLIYGGTRLFARALGWLRSGWGFALRAADA